MEYLMNRADKWNFDNEAVMIFASHQKDNRLSVILIKLYAFFVNKFQTLFIDCYLYLAFGNYFIRFKAFGKYMILFKDFGKYRLLFKAFGNYNTLKGFW